VSRLLLGMIMDSVIEIEKLREFLLGALMATRDNPVLEMACSKIDDILRIIDENHAYNKRILGL
jgi:hypothetical protein